MRKRQLSTPAVEPESMITGLSSAQIADKRATSILRSVKRLRSVRLRERLSTKPTKRPTAISAAQAWRATPASSSGTRHLSIASFVAPAHASHSPPCRRSRASAAATHSALLDKTHPQNTLPTHPSPKNPPTQTRRSGPISNVSDTLRKKYGGGEGCRIFSSLWHGQLQIVKYHCSITTAAERAGILTVPLLACRLDAPA